MTKTTRDHIIDMLRTPSALTYVTLDVVSYQVRKNQPGLTRKAVASALRRLVAAGTVIRTGEGGPHQDFTYRLADEAPVHTMEEAAAEATEDANAN